MCIFCEIAKGNIPSYTIYEDDYVRAFLDLSQATKGHTLVVPKKHVENIFDMDEETMTHISNAIVKVSKILKNKLNIEALNIVNNSGALAGQTVMHAHFHLIPRYLNDDVKLITVDHAPSKEEMEKTLKELK